MIDVTWLALHSNSPNPGSATTVAWSVSMDEPAKSQRRIVRVLSINRFFPDKSAWRYRNEMNIKKSR